MKLNETYYLHHSDRLLHCNRLYHYSVRERKVILLESRE